MFYIMFDDNPTSNFNPNLCIGYRTTGGGWASPATDGTTIIRIDNNSQKTTFYGTINTDGLTASSIVEINSGKNLVGVAKGTAYNANYGTTAGTVAAGDHNHSGVYHPNEDQRLSSTYAVKFASIDTNIIDNTSSTTGNVSIRAKNNLYLTIDSNNNGTNGGIYVLSNTATDYTAQRF